jgi:adenylylsulfate kinase
MSNPASTNIKWHIGDITADDRARVLRQRGVTVWFTGLSGSGKSTIAVALEKALLFKGHVAYRLDGDNIRHGLNRDLGFSADDRTENIRRIAEVARLFADAGIITLVSFISPYRADRQQARDIHERAGNAFLEIHVDCDLSAAEQRDPKGLYKKARAGQITQFTGIDAPYEAPEKPDLRVRTDEQTVEQSVNDVVALLLNRNVLGALD